MSALPSSVNYQDAPMGLPDDVVSKQLSLTPVNGGSFVPGGIIQFDFVNSGYIVPDSIFLRYKYAFTNLVNSEMTGCPFYSPFSRMEVLIGSNVVESQSQYSQTCCMNTQLELDVAQSSETFYISMAIDPIANFASGRKINAIQSIQSSIAEVDTLEIVSETGTKTSKVFFIANGVGVQTTLVCQRTYSLS